MNALCLLRIQERRSADNDYNIERTIRSLLKIERHLAPHVYGHFLFDSTGTRVIRGHMYYLTLCCYHTLYHTKCITTECLYSIMSVQYRSQSINTVISRVIVISI